MFSRLGLSAFGIAESENPLLKAKYEKFNRKQNSFRSIFIVVLFFTLITCPLLILFFALGHGSSPEAWSILLTSIVIWIVLVFLLWILLILKYYQTLKKKKIPPWTKRCLPIFQEILLICITVFCCSRLFIRAHAGQCDTNKLLQEWTCNPHGDSRGLPLESFLTAMLLPLVYCVILRDAKYEMIWFSWVIVITTICFTIYWSNAMNAVMATVVYIPTSAFILYDNQRQNLKMFFKTVEAEQLLEENRRMQQENLALEMRHMIANVAHDLKTPLASFLSGVDMISGIACEFQEKTRSACADPQYIAEALGAIHTCVTNIRNTNSFMIMTINRCIDFTKASQGLKLVPKLETVELTEALELPLHVMKDMQNRVAITVHSISSQICSHIITDKQWLQENVLCLLSNAVKYSNRGTVSVSLKVVPKQVQDNNSMDDSGFLQGTVRFKPKAPTLIQKLRSSKVTPGESGLPGTPSSESPSSSMSSRSSSYDEADRAAATATDNYQLRIEVEDCGIGITEDVMENLFNPFKQAQRLAGGTGLGLYSLAKRVEALKGSYGVQKRRDGEQGSLFWFSIPYRPDSSMQNAVVALTPEKPPQPLRSSMITFSTTSSMRTADSTPIATGGAHFFGGSPAVDAPAAEEHKERSTRSQQASSEIKKCRSKSGHGLRVLLVDDSVPILKMTSMMLTRQGHTVVQAENGAEALEKLIGEQVEDGDRYDVVLMDLQMPVMDGLEAVRRFREYECSNSYKRRFSFLHTASRRQIIIGVSANSDSDTTEDAFRAGVDAFMGKPFSVNTFYDTFKRLRDHHL